MAKCPICNKSSSNKEELLKHVEKMHKDDIPDDMSTAQYVYSLVHGRPYGICRICGKPTPWNEKAGKPKQICGSPQCKEKVSKEFEKNLMNKRHQTRQDRMNDPDTQEQMLANRKISGVYTWSDKKHKFTYTGSYELYALKWLDDVMDIDPDGIRMPGPRITYTYNGKEHLWITDMYLVDYNIVIEIKDGSGTGNKNTHPGFAHNRELEKAKDEYMRHQTNCNYIKLTNQNMLQLVDVLSKIRLDNIFDEENNKKSSPIIAINESIGEPMDEAIAMLERDYETLQEANITTDKIIGVGKEMYLKCVALVKDVYRKWNGIKEIDVSEEEKKLTSDMIKKMDSLLPKIERCLKGENVSYENEFYEFINTVRSFRKVHANKNRDKKATIEIRYLERIVKKIEGSLNRVKNLMAHANHVHGAYKNAYWTVCNRCLYCINLLLYGVSGRGMVGVNDKGTGTNKYRYGHGSYSVDVKNMNKADDLKEAVEKLRKCSSYAQYKKLFDEVCEIYNKKDISVFKIVDFEKYNKIVFINYGKLKPMTIAAGTPLYHISTNGNLSKLDPFFKSRDNITFYSSPRIYFTDKLQDPNWVIAGMKQVFVYRWIPKKDITAYRDSEYGPWRHPAIYVESNQSIKIENITEEAKEMFAKSKKKIELPDNKSNDKKTTTENIEYLANVEYESLMETVRVNYDGMISKDYIKNDHRSIDDKMNHIGKAVHNIKRLFFGMDDKDKQKYFNKTAEAMDKAVSTSIRLLGIEYMKEGWKGLKGSKDEYKETINKIPTNRIVKRKISVSIKMKYILYMVYGVLSMMLSVAGAAVASMSNNGYIRKLYFRLLRLAEKIDDDSIRSQAYRITNLINNANLIREATECGYDIEDLPVLNETITPVSLTDEEIDILCEDMSELPIQEDNGIEVLTEAGHSTFDANKKSSLQTFNPTAHKWFNVIFGSNGVLKRNRTPFCEVRVYDNTLEIRGINYTKLRQHINKLYGSRNISKIFEYIYYEADWKAFNKKKITRSQCRIDYIKTYTFFALELSIMFKELYDEFRLEYYSKIAGEIYTKTWLYKSDLKVTRKVDMKYLNDINPEYKLKPYQYKFIDKYPELVSKLNLNGYILSFDQGLGKTLTAIALGKALNVDRMYIVCPNALKDNWALEIKSYFDKYKDDDVWHEEVYVHGGRYKFDKNRVRYVIVNQEAIPKIYDKVISGENMLVVDESHNFRNINGKRVGELVTLRDKLNTENTLVMSGTPIKASPSEITPALRLIDPLFTDEVAQVYNKCFNVDNIAASGIIQSRFGRIMYRKTKDEVLSLPNKTIESLEFNVSDPDKYLVSVVSVAINKRYHELYKQEAVKYLDYKKEYNELVRKYSKSTPDQLDDYLYLINGNFDVRDLHELDREFRSTYLSKYVYPYIDNKNDEERLRFLVKHFAHVIDWCIGTAVGEILHPRRKELFLKLYDENSAVITNMIYDNIKKTVIFTPLKDVANHIHKKLGDAGLASVIVTGDTKDKLTPILRFKEDPNVDVLVTTTQTLGTGVTLVEANLMFFFGTPWRSADFDQCCDRIYRIGQTDDVFIFNVVMKSSSMNLSARMDQILQWSKTMFDTMIDHSVEEE